VTRAGARAWWGSVAALAVLHVWHPAPFLELPRAIPWELAWPLAWMVAAYAVVLVMTERGWPGSP
jgi:hypothetical protein